VPGRGTIEVMANAWIEIDQRALRANAESLRSLLDPATQLLGVVKSNAYGHGLAVVVPLLDSLVDFFGVDDFEEAVAVRALSAKPVLILNPLAADAAEATVCRGFHQMVSSLEDIDTLAVAAEAVGTPAHVHLKVDTGMSRQGFPVGDFLVHLHEIVSREHIAIAGIATHFANADVPGDSSVAMQHEQFRRVLDQVHAMGLRGIRHAANSAATILEPDTHYDLVRCGIALYGIWPDQAVLQAAPRLAVRPRVSGISLEPVLQFRTRISLIKEVAQGEGVGYGLTKRFERSSRIALLPIGYGDGYSRTLSNISEVLIRGQRAPVVGRISMNLTTVDITDLPEVSVGDTVTLLGRSGKQEIAVEELAQRTGTIPYEIVTALPRHLPRVII